jgi:uncharacterized RDD family membrane protein YckC
MFTIIGGDGKEYGPVTADQVRAWITAGRASLDTQARVVGSEEWRRIGDYAEFGQPETPPPMPTAQSMGGYSSSAAPSSTVVEDGLAGRGERMLARLIDGVLNLAVFLPGLIMIALAAIKAGLSPGGDFSSLATVAGVSAGLMAMAIPGSILCVVQLWMLTTRGQTIGKRVMGIRIVTFDTEENPGFVRVVLLREIAPSVIGLTPYVGLLFTVTNYSFIFRGDRRCIHDLIAQTKVIKV